MMMESISDSIALIAAAISVAIAVYVVVWEKRRRFRRRTRDLRAVGMAYEAHCSALEAVLNDPALSDALKDSLVSFSEAVAQRKIASAVSRSLINGELFQKGNEPFSFSAELDSIRRTRPDLSEKIAVLIHTGTLIMFLRWPETSVLFQQFMAEMASDTRKDFAVASKVTGFLSKLSAGPIGIKPLEI